MIRRKGAWRTLCAVLCALLVLLPGVAPAVADVGAGELQVHAFRLGKADSFLVYTSGHAVLIDTGCDGDGKEILSYLRKKQIPAIDVLILTHFDQDHIGGAAEVLRGVPVARVLQSNCEKDSAEMDALRSALGETGLTAETVREDLSFTLDGAEYTVIAPRRESYSGGDASNNSSLVTSLVYGETSVLFTGDIESARISELCALGVLRHADAMQIPHHGVYCDALADLLTAVTPETAFFTSSADEPEDEETLDLLEQQGITVCRIRTGKFNLHTDGHTVVVKTG